MSTTTAAVYTAAVFTDESMADDLRIKNAMDSAAALKHRERAMRITFTCGHLRLMPKSGVSGQPLGAFTACTICTEAKGEQVAREVVKVEETGVLHQSWFGSGRP